jgi:hypothetical protein
MHEPGETTRDLEPLTPGLQLAMVLSAVGTLVLGILPGTVLDFAQRSTTFVK